MLDGSINPPDLAIPVRPNFVANEPKPIPSAEPEIISRNPPMEGRATPLKDDLVDIEQQKADLRKAFGPQGDALVSDLFKKIDADVQVGQNVINPKTKEKPQKHWSWTSEDINNFIKNLFEKIKNSFKNLFR